MEIIMPAAGLSTRFPNMRPKYMLTDNTGKMMFEKSLAPYLGKYHITMGILQQHQDEYQIADYVKKEYSNVINIIILPSLTKGPADTVNQIINQAGISGEILIRDCDSFFDHEPQEGNYVCVSDIQDHDILKRLSSKSFVVVNNQGILTSIKEKQVISSKFCVGGYKFEEADLFTRTFEKLIAWHDKEIFVSHIIEDNLNNLHIFKENLVTNYIDVGTAEDWLDYNKVNN